MMYHYKGQPFIARKWRIAVKSLHATRQLPLGLKIDVELEKNPNLEAADKFIFL